MNFKIKNLNANDAEIYIYDAIGADFFGEGITAKGFAEALAGLSASIQNIYLRINSPGGDVFDGYAIYNQLVRHNANVIVDIDGLAASIASVIAMAGDEIRMADNALFMIHNPWSFAMGEAKDMRKTADLLDLNKENLISTYQVNSPLSTEEISDMMDNETWLTAAEALEHGFINAISDELAMAASVNTKIFKNAPKAKLDKMNDAYNEHQREIVAQEMHEENEIIRQKNINARKSKLASLDRDLSLI